MTFAVFGGVLAPSGHAEWESGGPWLLGSHRRSWQLHQFPPTITLAVAASTDAGISRLSARVAALVGSTQDELFLRKGKA